ncbi:outer membrane lipoprotein chaperone LolA [Paraglaciecola arctica]|uniref:Outer-membrane lipoprotein carrier protein n=1 Tax=Paraglaciecola arctica BSs20135 TaxID=493475 RepID=K6XCG3_9ALTE|nr:outer membrane lipoprotein chaperone LolA [Paraglaciecola arctica]GAC18299.1 outer membrane lipoprotein carrier protein [Paraglaciecola arctica BSs20135]
MNKLTQLKQLWLLTAVLITSTYTFAADMDAKQQLKVKLSLLATYQANFTQTVVDIENTLLQQASGRIVLQQPNKLYWELFEPNESVLLADGDNIWNVDPFLEQVVVNSADVALDNNPLILLTNPDSSKWQEFTVSQSDNQFIITPLELNGGIESLRLVFNGDLLVELESQDGQQQKSVLSFSDIKQNKPLPANTFIFVMPEGYELDDQR